MTAARTPEWLGVLGSGLVALGACSTAFSANPDGWPAAALTALGSWQPRPLAAVLISVGTLLLCLAWVRAFPDAGAAPRWSLLPAWGAPLLLVPPVTSADPFLYADLGYQLARGADPYAVGLGGAGGPYAAWIDPFWLGHGVAYPPLGLEVSRAMVALAGEQPYAGVLAQRLPALAGIALMAFFLPRIAARLGLDPGRALWLGVLNPVLVIHFVGGAHNDALMTGVVVAALWLALQPTRVVSAGLVLAPMLLGVAAGLKQQAVLAVLAVAGFGVVDRLRALPLGRRLLLLGTRTMAALGVSVATFAAITWATGLGYGWTRWLGEMGRARTVTPAVLVDDVVAWTGADVQSAVGLVVALVAAGWACWFVLRHADDPVLATAGGSLAALFVAQAIHPWYLCLCLALVALTAAGERLATPVVVFTVGYLLTYTVQFTFWIPPAWALPAVVAVLWPLTRAGALRVPSTMG